MKMTLKMTLKNENNINYVMW